MANQEHLGILKQGVEVWNEWRKEHDSIRPDLGGADLKFVDLGGADLKKTDLNGADLTRANLEEANLSGANLSGANLTYAMLRRIDLYDTNLTRANLHGADLFDTDLERANLSDVNLTRANLNGAVLYYADLTGANLERAELSDAFLNEANLNDADLTGANLERADLTGANLNGAGLTGANLERANLIDTNLTNADLTGCRIFGISAWKINLEGAIQKDLVITDDGEPKLTVDNLEVAQFIYLLLNNQKIRDVIDTITSKVVLILGRFGKRKTVLDALRDELRNHNYLPVVFDFEKPSTRDLTETVSTLAHLARFIILDLTDPSSAPHEAATIIPQCIVPVQPLLLQDDSRYEYALFQDLRRRHDWVLPTYRYQNTSSLLAALKEHIIDPAEQKAQELEQRK